MTSSLTVPQVAGLVVAALVGGVALLTLLLAAISKACSPDQSEGTGCGIIGGLLLVGAVAFSVWVQSAA